MYKNRQSPSSNVLFVLLLGTVTLLSVYFLLRFAGRWGEIDTYNATLAIRDMSQTGLLVPGPGYYVYPNGYAFQVIAVFFEKIAGTTLAGFQLYGAALLAIWVVFPAWLTYRELTGSPQGATLATVFLLVQPEFLFPIMRGTHEKFARGFMLLAIYLLIRSINSEHKPTRFAAFVLAFYTSIYALISLNNLLSTSFIFALVLTLFFSFLLTYRQQLNKQVKLLKAALSRLNYVILASLLIAFLFTFFAYAPAQHDISVMGTMVDRISALVLDVETSAGNPYSQWVGGAWINYQVYLLLTLANWLLLVASALIWFYWGLKWFSQGEQIQRTQLLLWALYGAFAVQGALSILVDLSGVLSANMQHRIFPSFAMLAAPLAARFILEWQPRELIAKQAAYLGLTLMVGLLAILSVLKASNEPLVSNKWLFYIPGEMSAIYWAEEQLTSRRMWLGYDERLDMAYGIREEGRRLGIRANYNIIQDDVRDILISDLIQQRSVRLGRPLPVEVDSLISYDNGQTQIYHLRPRTPFQR